MKDFDLKQWLVENKSGMYSKTSINEALNADNAFADGQENRGDMSEITQGVADAEMQYQDDLHGDMVDNASMGVVAEDKSGGIDTEIKDWEVNILGKDHIVDADVTVYYHVEGEDREDHMVVSPGGYYVDDVFAVITKLGVEDGDTYRDVTDPAYIKQIQDLLNKDPKLSRKLEDEVSDTIDWGSVGDDEDKYEPDMEETVGWATIEKPAQPEE